jgi:tripartite-type tricarboxylate transporter receptor subunit TctC
MIDRRAVVAGLPAMGLLGKAFAQQAFPSRPIKLVVGVLPGGTVDLLARMLAEPLSRALKQPVVVDNRPGAASRIACEYVAHSAPDGHTLMITSNTNSIVSAGAASSGAKLPYDLLRDFAQVTQLVSAPYALAVSSSLPVNSARELVALARAKPGGISYGSSGVGALDHLAGALFASMAGIELLHVPHRGMGPFMNSLLAGDISCAIASLPALLPHLNSGRVKLLAVAGSARIALMPNVPTLAESVPLPGYDTTAWLGIVTTARTPPGTIVRLNAELVRIVRQPAIVREQLAPKGFEPVGSTPEQMRAVVRGEIPRYEKIIREKGIVLE